MTCVVHSSTRYTIPWLPVYFVWMWGIASIERRAFCSSALRKGDENSPAWTLTGPLGFTPYGNGLRTHCCLSHRFLGTITVKRFDPQPFKGIPYRQGLMPYSVRGALVVSQSRWASSRAGLGGRSPFSCRKTKHDSTAVFIRHPTTLTKS